MLDFISKVCFDLFDHFGVFGIGEVGFAGVHLEDAAVFVAALVFGYEVEVEVAACVAIGAVVDLLGVEGFMKGAGCIGYVGKEEIALLLADVYDLAYVILICYDYSAQL